MKTFELKEEHLKLLARANWRWQDCEFGAPEIHPKRPYGNSSVIQDIAEILGEEEELCPNCREPLKDVDGERLEAFHHELKTAIQLIFSRRTFIPGVYKNVAANDWDDPEWEPENLLF